MEPIYAAELRGVVARQLEYLRQLDGARLLMAVPSFVEALWTEPVLRMVADDLLYEAETRMARFAAHDIQTIARLRALWSEHGARLISLWAAVKDSPAKEARGQPVHFESYLTSRAANLPSFREPHRDESTTDDALTRLEFWFGVVDEAATETEHAAPFREMRRVVAELREQHARAFCQYLLDGTAHAGAALCRLRKMADGLLPAAVGWDPTLEDRGALLNTAVRWSLESQVSLATFPQNDRDRARQLEFVAQVRRDVELASVEVLRRVGLSLSYRGLLRRFKTRCERFDVDFLREKLDQMSANGRREDFLTKRCAEYLFDQGLDPLFNASIAGRLRPDLFQNSGVHSLYIEAKQYTSRSDVPAVRKAAWQLWSTWSELEGPYNVREGFLLVFRLGGPLVVFEQDVRFSNRTLHPLLVDLAPGDQRGSAEKEATIHISAADMLPQPLV
jgi:hypothetical protein